MRRSRVRSAALSLTMIGCAVVVVTALPPIFVFAGESGPGPPACLTHVGLWSRQWPHWGVPTRAATDGRHVFFGAGSSVIVAEIGLSGNPRVIAELAEPEWQHGALHQAGSRLVIAGVSYLTLQSSVRIIDVDDPLQPTEIGRVRFRHWASSLAVVDDLVFVAAQESGLRMIDISDPTDPIEIGALETPYAWLVTAAGAYAYISDNREIHIVDVSTPSSPTVVSHFAKRVRSDMRVQGHFLYTLYGDLCIIDIAEPTAPVEVACTEPGGTSLAVEGDYAYVAGYGNGLTVVDVSIPERPVVIGNYNDVVAYESRVAVDGSTVWLSGAGGVHVIDVSEPTAPTETGFFNTRIDVKRIAVSGDFAYVAGSSGVADPTPAIWVIDVSSPMSSYEVAHLEVPDPVEDIDHSEGYVFLAHGEAGMSVVDVRDPAFPSVVSLLETSGDVRGIAAQGATAYVGDSEGRLLAVDVSDPDAPRPASVIYTPAPAERFVVDGHYLFLAQGQHGLIIVDIRDPGTITEVSRYSNADSVRDVSVDGNHVFAVGSRRLWVIDVTDPSTPLEVGPGVEGPLGTYTISSEQNIAYATIRLYTNDPYWVIHRLMAVDLHNPVEPGRPIFRDQGSYLVDSIAVSKGLVYVPKKGRGFDILAGCAPLPPRMPDGRSGG